MLCAFPAILSAQPGFNKHYDFGFPRNQFRNLIVHQDTIIGYGIARVDAPPYQQCLFLARFDSNGVPVDNRLICDSLGGAFSADVPWCEIMITSDRGYGLTAFSIGRYDGMFVKLKSDLTVEFIKEYPDSVSLVEYYRKIIETPGGYLLCGHLQRPNYQQDAFIRKVDKQGGTVWFKYYGNYNEWDFFSNYLQLEDNRIIGIGGYQISNSQPAVYRPWVAVFDTNGVVLKQWRPANDVGFTVAHHIYPIESGKWLIYAKRAAGLLPNGNVAAQSCLAVIDTSFQVKVVTDIGTPSPQLGTAYDFEPMLDGNFICAGEISNPNPIGDGNIKHGWLLKCTPQADTLWSRIDLPIFQNMAPTESYFGGVGVLSSGNIVAGGSTTIANDRFCWLVKVTPDGCIDTIFCQSVGVEEATEDKEVGIRFYPNPAKDVLFVEMQHYEREMRVFIYTANGQMVLEKTVLSSQALHIEQLPPGLYFLRAVTTKGNELYQKLMIVR